MNPFDFVINLLNQNKIFPQKSLSKKRSRNSQKQTFTATAVAVEILEDRTLLDASNPDVTLTSDVTEIGEYWKVPTFTATLSEVSTEDVTVNLDLSGTATQGVDYGAWQQFITVTAGDLPPWMTPVTRLSVLLYLNCSV